MPNGFLFEQTKMIYGLFRFLIMNMPNNPAVAPNSHEWSSKLHKTIVNDPSKPYLAVPRHGQIPATQIPKPEQTPHVVPVYDTAAQLQ